MTNTALLIHTASGYALDFAQPDAEKLIAEFARKLKALGLPVFLCVADAALSKTLQALLPAAKVLPLQSEIAAVRAIFAAPDIMHIAVATGVFPLFDIELLQKLFTIHAEYRADITYGENLPAGIAPHLASRDLLESLEIMEAKDSDLAESGIRPFVEKNINQFHAEVHYEEPDLRLLRLDFSLATKRSFVKTAAILPQIQKADAPYAELQSVLSENPGLLVSFPSYIELEFSSTADHVSYFSPLRVLNQQPHHLSAENFAKVEAYIAAGFGDTSVCASGLGEPLGHPDAVTYITRLIENDKVRQVFIESDGLHLDKLWPLATHAAAHKLRVIVLLNSLSRYADLSGAPQLMLERVKANVQSFTRALAAAGKKAQEIVYLQAFKVVENETEIDSLYALAEDLGATFLLQKYNSYAGLLPERRVSDMTPLERSSCWHLRRDLFIRANGDVAFCKQTVDQSKNSARGNLAKDSLAELWNQQRNDFVLNYKENFPSHLPCAACDEYFTFNF